MTTEIEGTATPAAEKSEQAQQVELTSTDATAEPTQGQQDEASEEKAKKEPWFQKRIGELTRDKYENKRQAETAAQENAQLREQLARVQQGDPAQQTPNDVQSYVKQEVQRLVAEQSFNETCNKVYATGKAEFPDFDNAVANLQMIGVNRDFLELVTTSDAGVKLLHHLGTDMDEAVRIAALPPVQMARELTRLEYKLGQAPAAKPVSKAPAPIKPISGHGVGSKSPGEMSDAEYSKWRSTARK